MVPTSVPENQAVRDVGHLDDLKLAASKMLGAESNAQRWKGIHPAVELSRQVYKKGISLSKEAMRAVEARLELNSKLPKWDILIRPAGML